MQVTAIKSKSRVLAVALGLTLVVAALPSEAPVLGNFPFTARVNANDDRNVLLVVSNPGLKPATFNSQVETRQIAPTVLNALGLDPNQLQAVQQEGTTELPGLPF